MNRVTNKKINKKKRKKKRITAHSAIQIYSHKVILSWASRLRNYLFYLTLTKVNQKSFRFLINLICLFFWLCIYIYWKLLIFLQKRKIFLRKVWQPVYLVSVYNLYKSIIYKTIVYEKYIQTRRIIYLNDGWQWSSVVGA